MPVSLDNKHQLLYRELTTISYCGWLVLAGFALMVAAFEDSTMALQWLIQAALFWVLVVHQSRNRIDLNRSSHEKPLYENLGWANRLTILRGGLIAMVGGFLLMDWPESFVGWIPGILYTLAAIIDRLDGYVARKSARTSLLGIELDTVFDALGLAIAPLLAVFYGQIHWSYLLFGSAWYLFQWGIFRRRQKNLPVYKLAPNITRRAWAGFQMGFIGIVLFPVFSPPFTTVCGIAFMLPVLTGFMIDWLVVSGHIDRHNPETDKFFRTSWQLIQSAMQPLLRVILSLIILSLIGLPETVGEAFALLLTLMLLAGFVGRTVALVLLGLAGVYYQYQVFDLMAYVLTCSLVWLLLLGTGSFSLSRADENWIHRYDGA